MYVVAPMIDTSQATFMPRENKKTARPTKKSANETWRSTGSIPMIIGTCHVCSPAYRNCRILARSRAELSEDDGDVLVEPLLDQNCDEGSDEAECQTHEPQTVQPLVGTAGRKVEGGRGGRDRELRAVRHRGIEYLKEKESGCLVVIGLHVLRCLHHECC